MKALLMIVLFSSSFLLSGLIAFIAGRIGARKYPQWRAGLVSWQVGGCIGMAIGLVGLVVVLAILYQHVIHGRPLESMISIGESE